MHSLSLLSRQPWTGCHRLYRAVSINQAIIDTAERITEAAQEATDVVQTALNIPVFL